MADEKLPARNERYAKASKFTEYLSDLLGAGEKVSGSKELLKAIAEHSPWWLEAGGSALAESVGIIKFGTKLLTELTKIDDPDELASIAIDTAYQQALKQALQEFQPEGDTKDLYMRDTGQIWGIGEMPMQWKCWGCPCFRF